MTSQSGKSGRGRAQYEEVERLLKEELGPELQITRFIGYGAMAGVFLGRETALQRLVAVKVMSPELAKDERARKRFEREAQSAAKISHPNVVAVHSIGRLSNDVPYLVMEYVKGRNLAEMLSAQGAFSVDETRRVVADVAGALDAAHKKGIVHRDVKPANVMYETDSGRVLLTDFGIAAILDSGEEEGVRLTRVGEVLGDPTYISPEQLNGDDITERSDVFALGIMACELLTGRGQDDTPAVQRQRLMALRNDPSKLNQLRPDVDAGLVSLVGRCMAQSPAHRPDPADVSKMLKQGGTDVTSPDMSVTLDSLGEPVGFLGRIRARRMPQIVGAYAAGGWLALEGVGLLLENIETIPDVTFDLALATYLFALPGVVVLAWFHGKPGEQTLRMTEIWIHLTLVFMWIVTCAIIIGNQGF